MTVDKGITTAGSANGSWRRVSLAEWVNARELTQLYASVEEARQSPVAAPFPAGRCLWLSHRSDASHSSQCRHCCPPKSVSDVASVCSDFRRSTIPPVAGDGYKMAPWTGRPQVSTRCEVSSVMRPEAGGEHAPSPQPPREILPPAAGSGLRWCHDWGEPSVTYVHGTPDGGVWDPGGPRRRLGGT